MFVHLCLALSLAGSPARHGRAAKTKRNAPATRVEAPAEAASAPAAQDNMAQAENAFTDYRYADAIPLLEAVLADPELKDALRRQRARLLLGFSHYYQKDEGKASEALVPLFRENADYPVDRDEFHPSVVAFYTREHNRYVAALNEAPASVAVVAPPPVVKTAGDRHPWVRIFPGGIGHFVNYDFAAGGVFLGLELALAATNVTASVLKYQMRLPNGHFPAGQDPLPWHIVQNASAFALIALAVIEIVDAFAWSPARGRAKLAAKQRAEIDLGPLGSYRLVWGAP